MGKEMADSIRRVVGQFALGETRLIEAFGNLLILAWVADSFIRTIQKQSMSLYVVILEILHKQSLRDSLLGNV